jgi:hypothetical protein
MAQEIVRNVPRRASLLSRRDIAARPSGRVRRVLAAAAVEAAPDLLKHRDPAPLGTSEPAEPTSEAPVEQAEAPAKPFTGRIYVGTLGDLLGATTSLFTQGYGNSHPVAAEINDGVLTSLLAVVESDPSAEGEPAGEQQA